MILADRKTPFRVETDASAYGIGAVLSQERVGEWLPIAFLGKGLSLAQQRYCTAERELLAIVLAIEYFQYYLYGEKFTVITDHKPLKHLLKSNEPASRLIRWRWRLSRFDFTIVYRAGTTNGNADKLSRLPTDHFSEASSSDLFVTLLKKSINNRKINKYNEFSISNYLIWKTPRMSSFLDHF